MANFVEIIGVAGQTVFNLPFSYTIGNNSLFVFYNGQLQYLTINYVETSTTSVTFTFPAINGGLYEFRTPPGTLAPLPRPLTFSFAPPLPTPPNAPILTF